MAHSYNKLPLRVKDDEGTHGSSAPLLTPSRVEPPTMNNSIESDKYHTSKLDLHSPKLRRSFWAPRPIIALILQFCMLLWMITFVVWTSTANRSVPNKLARLYIRYPQSTTTTVTLFGTLLSLINTKLFAEAVRFAIIVSLRNTGSDTLSLYSLYAATSISSRNLLFSFDRRRIRWTITSFILFALFTAQTSAWTTILTPRLMLIPNQSSFMDFNFTSPDLAKERSLHATDNSWARTSDSGIAAAREGSNITQYVSYFGNIFNGTSRGILPLSFQSHNWTKVVAIQQGLTANVTCEETPDSDLDISTIKITANTRFGDITQLSLCCNCTSGNTTNAGRPILMGALESYIALGVCPYQRINNTENTITVYVQSSLGDWLGNKTCTITPQLLKVNVTYYNNGLVTLEPTAHQLPDIPVNSSMVIDEIMYSLKMYFVNSQLIDQNQIAEIFFDFATEEEKADGDTSASKHFITERMANFIRGVFEHGATMIRYNSLMYGPPKPQPFPSTIYVQATVWGQVPELRLIITVAPLAVMMTTIVIILLSLYKARNVDLDHITSFDPMNALHIVAACSSGNVQNILFPDYSDINVFSNDVGVEIPERQGASGVAGFHVFRR